MVPVILSGGGGTRLWPLSRMQFPKQFLSLIGEHSLLQETLLRLQGIENIKDPIVVANEDHRFLVAEQIRELGLSSRIFLEPVGKNTAPAVALVALDLLQSGQDPILVVLPSDHNIQNISEFQSALQSGAQLAEQGKLVTFGVEPAYPESGFGYIHKGLSAESGYDIEEFVEKPSKEKAQEYIASGNYFWNAGIFMFKASVFKAELERFSPDVCTFCSRAVEFSKSDLDFIRVSDEAFLRSPSISIDHAVMEKTSNGVVVPLNLGWSDVGSWNALWDLAEKDADNNASVGDVLTIDSRNNFLHSEEKLVAAIGVEDLIVVQTTDATLVAKKERAQDVKALVDQLKSENRDETKSHIKVHRPWGSYESLNIGDGYQVKRVEVNPQSSLSLQLHEHRAEHWVVVKGIAKVTNGTDTYVVNVNQSTYIPAGTRHRLENVGEDVLQLIEIQSGSYLGEDDIIRFDDNYGRS